eukprot:TRINITY_DN48894_c0_g1_i1.p1 TRINITY_DN48894_c0_g1~~TRINITY_DN48894_c0_g1_i1.p1  ORF type:complete len:101 (+),score=8.35 TRINITY_DN48894_c0_g1_i1:271-573(+)
MAPIRGFAPLAVLACTVGGLACWNVASPPLQLLLQVLQVTRGATMAEVLRESRRHCGMIDGVTTCCVLLTFLISMFSAGGRSFGQQNQPQQARLQVNGVT